MEHSSIVTLCGQEIDFANLSAVADKIRFWDIAWPLHLQVRWTGQIPVMWDVLSHSVLCWQIGKTHIEDITIHEEAYLLLHDATEAYMCDVSRPLKVLLRDYQRLESALLAGILKRFGVDMNQVRMDKMHQMDDFALAIEAQWFERSRGMPIPPGTWSPAKIKVHDFRGKMLEVCTLLETEDRREFFALPVILEPYINNTEIEE